MKVSMFFFHLQITIWSIITSLNMDMNVDISLPFINVSTVTLSFFQFQSINVICKWEWNFTTPKELMVRRWVLLTCSKKIIHLAKWLVNHELLPAVLLVLWTLWISGAVWMDNDNHFLLTADQVITKSLWNPVPFHKLQDDEVLKLCRCGMNTEIIPFSDTVDQDLLHNLKRFVIILEALHNGALHCLQALGTRLRLGCIFGNIVYDPPSWHHTLHIHICPPSRQLHGVVAV